MARFDLGAEAREFAQFLSTLLNGTVCHGISLSAARSSRPDVFKVGYQIQSDDFRVAPIPLTIGAKPPTGYLGVFYSLSADREGEYLMVKSSVMTYGNNQDTEHPMLHYDYERDKAHGYPDAHLQVNAEPVGVVRPL